MTLDMIDDLPIELPYAHRIYHKLHLVISSLILQQFSQSQWLWKALKKTFQLMLVTSQGNQYWPRY